MKKPKRFGNVQPHELKISLGDLDADRASQLAEHFQDVDAVEVIHGNLLDLDAQAIVSPANSFGDMGGGIDKAIDDFHQGQAQPRVIAAIRKTFFGELPVGVALVVEIPARRFPYLIVAPTMRVPSNVSNTLNAYLAMRAVLIAVLQFNASAPIPIRTLAIPGLATGIGFMDPATSAHQMRLAYNNIIQGQWQHIHHPAQAPFCLEK